MDGDPIDAIAPPPGRVPTLTEVIEAYGMGAVRSMVDDDHGWRDLQAPEGPASIDTPPEEAVDTASAPPFPGEPDPMVHAIRAVLARLDGGDDDRLRRVLQPLIDRFTDNLVAAVRTELSAEVASTLRDLASGQTVSNQSAPPHSPPSDRHGTGVPFA